MRIRKRDDLRGLLRRTREEDPKRRGFALFKREFDWQKHWWGMPSFIQRNALPAHKITVNFICFEDVQEFARRLGLSITRQTDSTWFPKEKVDEPKQWLYVDEP